MILCVGPGAAAYWDGFGESLQHLDPSNGLSVPRAEVPALCFSGLFPSTKASCHGHPDPLSRPERAAILLELPARADALPRVARVRGVPQNPGREPNASDPRVPPGRESLLLG